jgi:hypothetical protein
MSEYIVKAIQKLKPNAEYSFTESDYSTVKWDVLEGDAPTQAEIDNAIKQIKDDEIAAKAKAVADKAALLAKLGITADEAKLLLS